LLEIMHVDVLDPFKGESSNLGLFALIVANALSARV
jgi:hypothetical protein